jgi:multidrug resistance efflux pump
VTVRTTTDASRAATLIVSPAVARSLIDELRNAVAALDAEMAASAAQVADAG